MFSSKTHGTVRTLLFALAASCCLLAPALADTLHLKDGRVIEGELVRREGAFVMFTPKGKNQPEIFAMSDVSKIVESEDAPKEEPKEAPKETPKDGGTPSAPAAPATPASTAAPAASTPASAAPGKKDEKGPYVGDPNRIAILSFGPPGTWQGSAGDMVGVQISHKSFLDAIPLLKEDKVGTVVFTINSGGGYLAELAPMHRAFQTYMTNFRTVAWIESAISAACMSPWVLPEIYMRPKAALGGNTGWSGALVAVKGRQLEQVLIDMEEISRKAGRDPKIMRAMQILEPLSANISEDGSVTFYQDETSGSIKLNPANQILTLDAVTATRVGVAKGIAGSREELAQAMKISEPVWAGQKATEYVDRYIREADRIEKGVLATAIKYQAALNAATQLANNPDDPRFGTELGVARTTLAELRKQVKLNPNFQFHLAGNFGALLDERWFNGQEENLQRLARRRNGGR